MLCDSDLALNYFSALGLRRSVGATEMESVLDALLRSGRTLDTVALDLECKVLTPSMHETLEMAFRRRVRHRGRECVAAISL